MDARHALALGLAGALLAPAARAQQNRFEPNQTRRSAARVEPGDYKRLHCDGEDWYVVDVPRGQRLEVSARHAPADGDLDVQLVDARGRPLGWSRTTRDEEACSFTPFQAMPVFVRVHGRPNLYDLRLALAPAGVAGPGQPGQVAGAGADFYAFAVEAGHELRLDVTLRPADGDLDLALYDDGMNELAASAGRGEREALRHVPREARTLLALVHSPERARVPYALRATVAPATPDDLARVLRRDRPAGAGQDLIELKNGDVLRGTVLDDALALTTPWAELVLPAARVAGLDLDQPRTGLESLHTVDGNRLTGFLRGPGLRVRLEVLDEPILLRRERIARVVFGRRGDERAGLERNQYVVLRNGDHFGARVVRADWALDAGFARLPLALAGLERLEFDGKGGVTATRVGGAATKGRLDAEEVELVLDIAPGPGAASGDAPEAGPGGAPAPRVLRVHVDRLAAIYCQPGFVPDDVTPGGPGQLVFDFDEGLEPWAAGGNGPTQWAHWPTEGVRGDGCLRACGPNGGNYGDNANALLTSPALSLQGLTAPQLRFQVKTRLERGPDFLVVRVSYDQGATWTELHRVTGDNEWAQVVFPLQPGVPEVLVQLGLVSDGSVVSQGVWLDALEVGDPPR